MILYTLMPLFNCDDPPAKTPIKRPKNCNEKVQFTRLAYGFYCDVDTTGFKVDEVSGCATLLTMLNGELMCEIEIDAEKTSFTTTYAEADGYYTASLTVDLTGCDKATNELLCYLQTRCDLFFVGQNTACKEFILGIDQSGEDFRQSYKSKIGAHTISFGNDSTANLITFNFKSNCPITESDIGWENLPLDTI